MSSNNKINLFLYSESSMFEKLIKSHFVENDIVNLVDCSNSVEDFKKKIKKYKDILVLLYASKMSAVSIIEIFNALENNNAFCVAVCDTTTLSFNLSKKGSLATAILRDNADNADIEIFMKHLLVKLRDADKLKAIVKVRTLKQELNLSYNKLIVFGSSTGGTEALLSILKELPAELPPILAVQHMPPVFTKMYADRLNSVCKATVWEAKDGDILKPGLVLIAPGDMQMRVIKNGGDYIVTCKKEGKVNGVEPSVDVLFESVCDNFSGSAIAVILTGMGNDGAKGLLKLRNKGAFTIGQDERSSVVYGMPKVAYDMGAVKVQAPLSEIAKIILKNI